MAKKFSYSSFDIYLLSFIISNYLAAWFIDKYFLSEEDYDNTFLQGEINKLKYKIATKYYNFFIFLLVQIAELLRVGSPIK